MTGLIERLISKFRLSPLLFVVLACLSCSHPDKSPARSEPSKPAFAAQGSQTPATSASPQARAVLLSAPPLTMPPADAQPPDRILRSGHTAEVDAVAFSSDGRLLATGSSDKTVRIWDLATGRSLHTLTGYPDAVRSLAFSPDGKRLASVGQDGTLKAWDTGTWSALFALTSNGVPTELLFSPDGQFLILGCGSKDEEGGGSFIEIRDSASGDLIRVIKADWTSMHPLVVTANGHVLSSGGAGADGDVDVATKIWDLQTGRELKSLPISAQAISSDGRQIASLKSDPQGAKIELYDTETGKLLRTLVPSARYVAELTFTRDGTRLIGTDGGSTIVSWDTATGKELDALPGERNSSVRVLAISPEGKLLAAASYSGYATKIWDLVASRAVRTLEGNPSSGYLLFDRGGHLLVSEPQGLRVWDVASGGELGNHSGVAGGRMVFSHDGNWLASNPQSAVKIWDTKTWAPANLSPAESAHIWWMGFVGPQLPSAVASSGVRSWRITDNASAPSLLGLTYAMAVSPDGTLLAAGRAHGADVDIWDLATGAKPITPAMLEAHQLQVESSVKLWDVGTWTPQTSLSFSGMGLGTAEFSADGRYLALPNSPGIIEIFDIAQSKTVKKLASQAYPGGNIAFSPDGSWLALFSQQGIQVWNITSPHH